MKTVILIREIYFDGFKNLGNFLIKHLLKAFTWFALAMFCIVLYAFAYRLFTGFAFS